MTPLQQRIAAITDTTANLIAQLRELDSLRERVRKAQAERQRRPKRRNISRVSVESAERGATRSRSGPLESTAAVLGHTALG